MDGLEGGDAFDSEQTHVAARVLTKYVRVKIIMRVRLRKLCEEYRILRDQEQKTREAGYGSPSNGLALLEASPWNDVESSKSWRRDSGGAAAAAAGGRKGRASIMEPKRLRSRRTSKD